MHLSYSFKSFTCAGVDLNDNPCQLSRIYTAPFEKVALSANLWWPLGSPWYHTKHPSMIMSPAILEKLELEAAGFFDVFDGD